MTDHPLRPVIDRGLGEPLPHQLPNRTRATPKADKSFNPKIICGISYPFGQLFLTLGHVPTRYSAVRRSSAGSKLPLLPLDLHVLGAPPAFILSQDQTLHKSVSVSKHKTLINIDDDRTYLKDRFLICTTKLSKFCFICTNSTLFRFLQINIVATRLKQSYSSERLPVKGIFV